jgi:hypothetical protein
MQLERLQNYTDKFMYIVLVNIIVGIGKNTEFEELKEALRVIYKDVKKTPNPLGFADGSIINRKAYDKINSIIVDIIDLLNDYYGNYKTLT